MSIVRGFLKIVVGLAGAVLMLGSVGIFFWGLFLALKGQFGQGVPLILGSIAISAVAVFLGKFSRGDFG